MQSSAAYLASLCVVAVLFAGCVARPVATTPMPTPQPPVITPPTPTVSPPELLPPDAVPRSEPRSAQGNPPFYQVDGKRYFVLPTAKGYRERGVASWYGPGFHKGKTSNGEPYDMHAMTAAHKTLPLPCYARVTNLRNGRSVIVRVNDRGPFKDTRIIDMSRSAATKLDMIHDGTTFVEVEAIDTENALDTPPAKTTALFVQAGAFGDKGNAERLVQRLKAEGVSNAALRRDDVGGRTLYRVRVGPVPTVNDFDATVAKLRRLGLQDARLATD